MAARPSTWSRRVCLGNKREWVPVQVSMMEHQPNEVMALLDEVAREPTCDELMLRTREATDKELCDHQQWGQERPSWRMKE
jgi:hypothetical protein